MFTSKQNKNKRLTEIQATRSEIALHAQFDNAFIVMNALSAVISSYTLVSDSVTGIIGGMLVAMVLGPIAGVSLSLVDGDRRLFGQSIFSLVAGLANLILTSLAIGLLHTDIPAGHELMARTQPNYSDLMVALAGGAVGAYMVISPRVVNTFVSVAVASAIVPPLCAGTIFAARNEWENAGGAYLLGITNIVAIQLSSSIVLWIAGFHHAIDHIYRSKRIIWLNAVSLSFIGLLFVALGTNTELLVSKELYETKVRKILLQEIKIHPGAFLSDMRINHEEGKNIIRILVWSPSAFSAEEVGNMEAQLSEAPNGLPTELRVRHTKVEVMTKQGTKFDTKISDFVNDADRMTANSP